MIDTVVRILEDQAWDLLKSQECLESIGISLTRSEIARIRQQEATLRLKQAIQKAGLEAAINEPKAVVRGLGTIGTYLTQEEFDQVLEQVALEKKAREKDWSPRFNPKW